MMNSYADVIGIRNLSMVALCIVVYLVCWCVGDAVGHSRAEPSNEFCLVIYL